MIHMPNDDTPWPLPNEDETETWKKGGLGQFTATALYSRRTKCAQGPALRFFGWYFASAEEIGAAIRQQWSDEDAGVQ